MRRILILKYIIFVVFVLAIADRSLSQITFDDAPVTTPPPKIGVRYGNQGVLLPKSSRLFTLPTRGLRSKAHSGTKVLLSNDLANEQDPRPLVIDLTYNIRAVTLYTGVPWDSHGERVNISLKAFNELGNLVARSDKFAYGPSDINLALQVKDPQMQHTIRKIEVDAQQGGTGHFEFIDDLTLSSEGPPPVLATEPPKVVITSPSAAETNTGVLTISGKIHGKGLLPKYAPPELTVSYPVDPSSGTLPHKQELGLNKELNWVHPIPSGDPYLAFTLPFQLTYFGKNAIKVTASNAAGSGSAQKSITYFPADITKEYNKKGKWNTFGDLIWGKKMGGCISAIYQKGAIFSSPAGTYSVLGKIFTKWKSLTTPNDLLGLLGCATGPEKSIPGGISQDFVGGRAYSGSAGTFYVITPFLDAIDKLNFVSEFGLPASDPVKQTQPGLPSLWQKFKRTIDGVPFVSAMEVTEKPLTVWIATPDIEGTKRAGAKITSRVATNWDSYDYKKVTDPSVKISKPKLGKGMPYSALSKACGGGHYPGTAPEWVSLSANKIVSYMGNVQSSKFASEDAPWSHDCSTWKDGEVGFAGVDWRVYVTPDAGYEGMLGGDGTTISEGRLIYPNYEQTNLEIEYEYCLVGFPPESNPTGYLKQGDKIITAGRFVVDCGCHPSFGAVPSKMCESTYKSEIHPPAFMFDIYTLVKSGQPSTVADMVYLDWWYPGEVVELDLYPPPRPKPDVVLTASIPIWNKFCTTDKGHCGIQNSLEPITSPNHIRLKITGRPDVKFHTPPNESTKNGQLFHGHLPSLPGQQGPIDPNYPHTKSLWGNFELTWKTP